MSLFLLASTVAISVAGGVVQEPAPSPPLRFRAEVRRVYVDVFVEEDGSPVGGLEARDFVVLDEGIEQTGVTLLNPNDYPISAVLILDTSDSVRGETLTQLKDAAHAFIDQLDAVDEVAVLSFGGRFRLRKALRSTGVTAREAVDAMEAGGGTALFDSIYAALVHAETGSGRPLVVLFSDGDDNLSWLSIDAVTKAARASNAVVYPVVARSELARASGSLAEPPVESFGRGVSRRIAQATAGRWIEVGEASRLTEAFVEIVEEMRSRYLLFFEPRADAERGWHTLEVRLRDRKGDARARAGYFLH